MADGALSRDLDLSRSLVNDEAIYQLGVLPLQFKAGERCLIHHISVVAKSVFGGLHLGLGLCCAWSGKVSSTRYVVSQSVEDSIVSKNVEDSYATYHVVSENVFYAV